MNSPQLNLEQMKPVQAPKIPNADCNVLLGLGDVSGSVGLFPTLLSGLTGGKDLL